MLTSQEMLSALQNDGGFTSWVKEDFAPESGYVVERTDYLPSKIRLSGHLGAIERDFLVVQQVATALQKAAKNGEKYAVGGWVDKGKTYVGVSQYISSKSEAVTLGQELGERAIWDIAAQKEVIL